MNPKYLNVTNRNNTSARVSPTVYATIRSGAYCSITYKTAEGKMAGLWFLRSPGSRQNSAAYVSSDGTLRYGGGVNADNVCVRPAFWLNLESDIF